jgi:nucleoid DNA-binding protein
MASISINKVVDKIFNKNSFLTKKNQASKVIDDFVSIIREEIKTHGEFKLFDFGKFKVITRKQKNSRNPKTGKKLIIPSKKILKFIPSKKYKEIK